MFHKIYCYTGSYTHLHWVPYFRSWWIQGFFFFTVHRVVIENWNLYLCSSYIFIPPPPLNSQVRFLPGFQWIIQEQNPIEKCLQDLEKTSYRHVQDEDINVDWHEVEKSYFGNNLIFPSGSLWKKKFWCWKEKMLLNISKSKCAIRKKSSMPNWTNYNLMYSFFY